MNFRLEFLLSLFKVKKNFEDQSLASLNQRKIKEEKVDKMRRLAQKFFFRQISKLCLTEFSPN